MTRCQHVETAVVKLKQARHNRMSPPSRSKESWHDRAARVWALAATMADTQAGILLTDLAADYDKLAEGVAIKTKGQREKSATEGQAQISRTRGPRSHARHP